MQKTFSAPHFIGEPIKNSFMLHCVTGIEEGSNVLYTTVVGRPSEFVVFDIEANRVVRSFPLDNGTAACWTHVKDSRGNIYCAPFGKSSLYRYSPGTKSFENLGALAGEAAVYHLSADEQDNIYAGTYPNAKIIKYSSRDSSFHDYGNVMGSGEYYAISSVYHKGYIYAGGRSSSPKMIRLNAETGMTSEIPVPPGEGVYSGPDIGCYYYMTLVRDYIFVILKLRDGRYILKAFDTSTQSWLGNFSHISLGGQHVTPELDGKAYFASNGGIECIDLDTMAVSPAGISYFSYSSEDNGVDYANGIMGGGWVELGNQVKYPGKTFVTVNYDTNKPVFINPARKSADIMHDACIDAKSVFLLDLCAGPDNDILIGSYMGTKATRYDVKTGSFTDFTVRQTEGSCTCNNKVYFGTYTKAVMWVYDPEKPMEHNVNPCILKKLGEHQDRPSVMIDAGGKLAVGTTPDYGLLGGALGIYDPESGEWQVYRNIVENQSIHGLAYKDSVIYGSTGIWGGLGIDPSEEEAKVFTFDIRRKCKTAEVPVKLQCSSGPLKLIGKMTFAQDGLLWAVSGGCVFAMDPATLAVVKEIPVCTPAFPKQGARWHPYSVCCGSDGVLYANPNSELAVIDTVTSGFTRLNIPVYTLTAGPDGNIYYTHITGFYRLDVPQV